MVFLEFILCCINHLRNYGVFKHFLKILRIPERQKKLYYSDNIEAFRKVERQNYSKIAKVSLKPFSTKILVIEFYTNPFKDLKPMLGTSHYSSNETSEKMSQFLAHLQE